MALAGFQDRANERRAAPRELHSSVVRRFNRLLALPLLQASPEGRPDDPTLPALSDARAIPGSDVRLTSSALIENPGSLSFLSLLREMADEATRPVRFAGNCEGGLRACRSVATRAPMQQLCGRNMRLTGKGSLRRHVRVTHPPGGLGANGK